MKKSLRTTFAILLTAAVILSLTTTVSAGNYSRKLSEAYTPKRIEAFKNVIRYYNPSVPDATAERIAKAIIFYSHKCEIEDDRFVAAVFTIESMFNPYAVSRSGARGLGQLMPGTARGLSVNNSFSIEENVHGSCRYLKQQLKRYEKYPRQKQYELTLAAYNAGPGSVRRWGGIPPYRETKNYVVDVINVWRQLSGLKPVTGRKLAEMRRRAAKVKKLRKQKGRSAAVDQSKPTKVKITRTYVQKTVTVDDSVDEMME